MSGFLIEIHVSILPQKIVLQNRDHELFLGPKIIRIGPGSSENEWIEVRDFSKFIFEKCYLLTQFCPSQWYEIRECSLQHSTNV